MTVNPPVQGYHQNMQRYIRHGPTFHHTLRQLTNVVLNISPAMGDHLNNIA